MSQVVMTYKRNCTDSTSIDNGMSFKLIISVKNINFDLTIHRLKLAKLKQTSFLFRTFEFFALILLI